MTTATPASIASSSSSTTATTASASATATIPMLPQHSVSPSPRRLASPLPLGLSSAQRHLGRSGSASNLSINFSPSRPIVRSYPASPTAASASSSASSMFPHYSSRARDGIHSLSPAAPRSGYNLRSAYSWSIPRHFDFELALSQLRRLLVNPKSVYQDIYFHKQTKNQWHRDDPAFTLSLAGLVTLSSLVWGLLYYQFTFPRLLGLTLRMLLVDYLLVGFAVACIAYLLANRTIMSSSSRYTTGHSVSLLYAWDVHLNAYVPYVMVAHGVQLMLAWTVTQAGPGITARVVGNAVYGLAWVLYVLYTYWGYRTLPFLMHPEYVLYLLAVLAIVWLTALNAGVNFSVLFLNLYS